MIVWEGRGNLLSDAGTQLCPINAAGAMGKGLAKTMRDAYPGLYERYAAVYHPDRGHPDMETRARRLTHVTDLPRAKVLLFCTKVHWYHASPRNLIEDNLITLANEAARLGITELAMPMIGCGEGKLDRDWVYNQIHYHLGGHPLPVRLYLGT